jgi:hypothetical protein
MAQFSNRPRVRELEKVVSDNFAVPDHRRIANPTTHNAFLQEVSDEFPQRWFA